MKKEITGTQYSVIIQLDPCVTQPLISLKRWTDIETRQIRAGNIRSVFKDRVFPYCSF